MMDHAAKARSRIYAQYRDKPRMVAWLTSGPDIAYEHLERSANAIITSYDVDTARGEDLNIIGRIVGVPRPVVRIPDFAVFGYEGNENYENYNVAPYLGEGDGVNDAPLSDFLYRRLVKAKIARNISDATYDDIIRLARFITGVEVITLVDNQDMTFSLGFEFALDLNTAYLVENFDIIPRPQGVEMLGWFVLPRNIFEIEAASDRIFNYANFTLPGDVA